MQVLHAKSVYGEEKGRNFMTRAKKKRGRRCIAVLLCACMILSMNGTVVVHADNETEKVGEMTDTGEGTGLCPHHPAHTEDCGYEEASDGAPCSHIHDETCGYQEGSAEIACDHVHDDSCGYAEARPCGHIHDETCGEDGEDCGHIHDEDCGYREESPCAHECGDDCSYQAAVEEIPCSHVHDENCGYRPATEGSPCSFQCESCDFEEDDLKQTGEPGLNDDSEQTGGSGQNDDSDRENTSELAFIHIILPEGEGADEIPAGEPVDLLEGVDFTVDENEDGLEKDDFYLAVHSATDEEEAEETVELTDERYLEAQEGHAYLVVYAVFSKQDSAPEEDVGQNEGGAPEEDGDQNEGGTPAATAERRVRAGEKVMTADANDARIKTFDLNGISIKIDCSTCGENVDVASITSVAMEEKTELQGQEDDCLKEYCGEKGYEFAEKDIPRRLNFTFQDDIGDDDKAQFDAALVSITITKEEILSNFGVGQELLAVFFDASATGAIVSEKEFQKVESETAEDRYTSITLHATYGDLSAVNSSDEALYFVILSADKEIKSSLEAETKFVAYDNGTEDGQEDKENGIEAADTGFTVTLPAGTQFYYADENGKEVPANYPDLKLKLERYTDSTADFDYDSHKKLINQHMSWHTGIDFPDESGASTNDVQFWRVCFVDDDGEEVDVKLPSEEKAKVVVEYLNETDALKGELGTRRTCVMDMGDPIIGVPDAFVDTDEYSLRTSYETEDIGKEDNHYTKITYYIDADEEGRSAWGNLTALCSMKLTAAYMQSASIQRIADGSAPWDALEADDTNVEDGEGKEPTGGEKDLPGNDSGNNNRIVRTFDSIVYTLQFVSASRAAAGSQMPEYVAVVEADLPMDITQARFDSTTLSNVFVGDEDWRIEYKDESGDNLYIENKSGIYKCDGNGAITSEKVEINQIANGSDNSGKDAYRTAVVSQKLIAFRKITSVNDQVAVPSTQTATVQINVTAAGNGDRIEPELVAYVKGNKDNFTSEQNDQNDYVVSRPSRDNEITTKDTDKSVRVSAAAWYNMVIKRNVDASYNGYFNFTTGQEGSKDDSVSTYGRMLSYGITLQLFNETNRTKADGTVDGAVLAEKGLRGVELPVDGITFGLELNGNPGKNNTSEDDYSAILWDYGLSREGQKSGQWGRNMYWKNSTATTFPKGASVYSSGSNRTSAAYASGNWNLTASGAGVSDDGKTTGAITDTGSGVTYTFTVSGFDFDFDNFTFPSQSAGNAGDLNWLAPQYIGSFSAGHIQVLQKYPVTVSATASPEITARIKAFEAVSISGARAEGETAEAKAVAVEATTVIGGTYDNVVTSNVAVYTPGDISKHNSFGDRDHGHGSISTGFLGEDYWGGPSYDANTFAGSSIYLWGGAQISRSSDALVSAYNLLQKFDSKVISIDATVENPVRYTEVNNDSQWPAEGWPDNKEGALLPAAGTHKFLYAADPLYPDGWDSNDPDQMERMNAAKEDELIYFTSLAELEKAGYTCIAVLLEVREAAIPAGCYPGVRIAVKVSDQLENIGKTVCTVNTARMWVKKADSETDLLKDISWENGSKNNLTRNELENLTKEERADIQNQILSNGEDVYSRFWTGAGGEIQAALQTEYHDDTASYLASNHNNCEYHKTVYKDGVKVEGTHEGYQQGMSLLVIGYESTVGIKVTNTSSGNSSTDPGLSGNVSFETPKGEWNPLYTITGIRTTPSDPTGSTDTNQTTNLTITASTLNAEGKNQISMGVADFKVQSLENGQPEWITFNEGAPATVTFQADGAEYTYTISARRVSNYETVFYLEGVPIGKSLPDIQFEGQLGADVEHNGNYTTQVTIQGDGDSRALSSGNRNIATISVTTTILEGTSLRKRVDKELIELNGEFTYSISYTNNAESEMQQKLYLYDLMPYNGDIRSTEYERVGDITEESDALQVQRISGSLSGSASSSENTVVRQYYSTIPGSVLREYVDFARGTDASGEDIDNLLRNALLGNDANGIWYVVAEGDGTHTPVPIYTYSEENKDEVVGINTKAVEYSYGEANGKVEVKSGYQFYNPREGYLAGNNATVESGLNGEKVTLECYKMFRWLGIIKPAVDGNNELKADQSNLTRASCLYAVVEHLGAGTTLTISATLKTNDNKADNIYGNIAHSWKAGDARGGANLVSNLVTTRVIGRELSGLVWEDVDHDGSRNKVGGVDEPTIPGVVCTLFKWNSTNKQYEIVKGDEGPNGRQISATYMEYKTERPDGEEKVIEGDIKTKTFDADEDVCVTTGKDGSYRFVDLAEGQYVVAFSNSSNGNALDRYVNGATAYQKSGISSGINNDGVANGSEGAQGTVGEKLPGIDSKTYFYYIKYSSTEKAEEGSNIPMRSLSYLSSNQTLLRNSVQVEEHLDLGLLIDRYELPETGGKGKLPYAAGGALLMLISLGGFWICRRKFFWNKSITQ